MKWVDLLDWCVHRGHIYFIYVVGLALLLDGMYHWRGRDIWAGMCIVGLGYVVSLFDKWRSSLFGKWRSSRKK